MSNAMLKYDCQCDHIISNPYLTYNSKPILKPKSSRKTSPSHFNSKPRMNSSPSNSFSTESSPVYKFSTAQPSRKTSCNKKGRGVWNFWMRYFTCFSPTKLEPNYGDVRTNKVHSVRSSPQSDTDSKGRMTTEEREEAIKEVIFYCKTSLGHTNVQD